jgi:hypothetical protein
MGLSNLWHRGANGSDVTESQNGNTPIVDDRTRLALQLLDHLVAVLDILDEVRWRDEANATTPTKNNKE